MKRSLVLIALLGVAGTSSATLFLINSPASYLRASGEAPFATAPINLNANGFFAGQTVILSRAGAFNTFGGGLPTDFGLSAVFSSSPLLLGPNQLNRVPGAIAAGPNWVSPVTFIGAVPTDIPEDFQVDNPTGTANGVTLVIPAGAQFIFAAAEDDFFSNNNNAPEFYLSITHPPVPEPSALVGLGLGLACLLGARRRRK